MSSSPLARVIKELNMSGQELRTTIKAFHLEMSKGLLGKRSSLKMIPSYADRPTGNEKGNFAALDLGGTNFRVLSLSLNGNGKLSNIRAAKFELKKEDVGSTGDRLFDLLASSLHKFIRQDTIRSSGKIPLGFTFSFPVEQKGIKCGKLVAWTKGFSASGVEDRDVVGLLERSIRRTGSGNILVSALVNDTVGTLVAGSYANRNCDMGVIIGTGTNACYVENIANIKKLKGSCGRSGTMIINIEWGNFNKLRTTRYDAELDASSSNPGAQKLEKMVAGKYLGHICENIIKDMAVSAGVFKAVSPENIDASRLMSSERISRILADRSRRLAEAHKLMVNMGFKRDTASDRRTVRKICELVTFRSARICAAVIVAVVKKIDPFVKREHVIAIDGSVYEKLPGFSRKINDTIKELLGTRAKNIDIVLTKDGSGSGAAITAASASGHAGD